MNVEISKKFRFESAHYLPGFPEGHKCRRMHGHSFEVEVFVEGPVAPHSGVVIDYGDVKRVVKPVIDALDHRVLNELGEAWDAPLLRNPTSEHIAIWLYHRLEDELPGLSCVKVYETCTSSCAYRGKS